MRSDRTPHLVEYGVVEVPSAEMEEKRALALALREFRDKTLDAGWEGDNGPVHAELVLVDEGYLAPVVRAFCKESGTDYAPAKGFGITQYLKQHYHHPRKVSETVAFVGDQYHLARIPGAGRMRLFDINADHWKSKLHAALRTPVGKAGGLTLHQPEAGADGKPREAEHLTIAKQFTAERPVESFDPTHGRVVRWRVVHRNNHFLDAGSMAMVAADYVASRREREAGQRQQQQQGGQQRQRRIPSPPAAAGMASSGDQPRAVAEQQGQTWFGARRRRGL
jgi:hypothetical protein